MVPVPSDEVAARCSTPAELEAQAIVAAKEINAKVDEWRATGMVAGGCPAFKATRDNAPPRSLSALITTYRKHPDFLNLAPSTRKGYENEMRQLEEWAGARAVTAITREHFDALMKALRDAGKPGAANHLAVMLRTLLNFGKRLTPPWVTVNIADDPGLTEGEKTGRPFPKAALAMFVEVADESGHGTVGTAIVLDSLIGQRPGDVISFRRDHYRNGTLIFDQRKTGKAMRLPLHNAPEVQARLDAELERQRTRGFVGRYLILTEDGLPYSEWNLRRKYRAVRNRVIAKLLLAKGWRQCRKRDAEGVTLPACDQRWWHEVYASEHRRRARNESVEDFMVSQAMADASFETDYGTKSADDENAFTVYAGDLWFQHMRHTAVLRMGEAGVPGDQIKMVTGHSLRQVTAILDHYQVGTGAIVSSIFAKVRAHEAGE